MTTPTPHPTGLRRILRTPHVAPLLAGTLTGRLPTAMAPVALLLAVRAEHGPLSLGAALAALYALAGAIGQPLLGRVVDRTRLASVVVGAAVVSTTAFALLAALGCTPRPFTACLLTVLAGAATPPLEAGLRAMWPRLVAPADLHAAFTLDSTTQAGVFVAGPLAATALGQLASPATALAACAVVGAAGSLTVAIRPPARRRTPARRGGHWSGPLRSPGLRLLLTALFAFGAALGTFNVLALALGEAHRSGWLAGLLPAALSTGSMIGGLLAARSPQQIPVTRRLLHAAACFAACLVPLAFTAAPPNALAAGFFAGLYLTPLITSSFVVTDRLAPPGTATEAAAWLIAVIGVGQAAGSAAAGHLAVLGTTALAALPPLAAAFTAALLAARRDLLTPNPPTEKPA
ncbi:MFS transporter [Kitasatospora saccharophila]|uniref:MFS transporter n=1 Tax=Kitasatospora saccharophila TaxID=407973 RepID=A0ABP5JN59_9ACTN